MWCIFKEYDGDDADADADDDDDDDEDNKNGDAAGDAGDVDYTDLSVRTVPRHVC